METHQLSTSGKMIRKLARKKAHQSYYVDGKRVLGASSIAKVTGDGADGLIGWGVNLAAQGIDFRKAREEAADVGTCAHFLISCFLEDADADLSEFSPLVTDKAHRAFLKFQVWWESQGLNVLHSELQMVSNIEGFGGTLDVLAVDDNTELVLLDIKVTARHRDSHDFQVAGGYRKLYEETHPGEEIKRTCILRIPPEGEAPADPKWIANMDGAWEVFKAQLEFLKRHKAYRKSL